MIVLRKIFSIAILTAAILFAAHGLAAPNYLGNTKSMKFHFYGCSTIKYPDAPHFVPFNSRDEALAAGYSPCQRCKP